MKMPVVVNPNRFNIFYEKLFKTGSDFDFLQELLNKIAIGLKAMKIGYPLTIIYLPLKWCGFAYKSLSRNYWVMNSTTQLVVKLFQRTGCLHNTTHHRQVR